MKITTLFVGMAFSLLVWTGCQNNSTPATNLDAAADAVQTRGSHSEQAPASAQKMLLARKWTNGDKFMDIKLEGTFAANLGNGEIAGTWEFNEESGELVFNGEKGAEGKGHAEKTSYTLKSVSDSELKIADAAGAELSFSAQ